jgi:hypothetical protein
MPTFEFVLDVMKFLYVQRVRGFAPPGAPYFDELSTERFEQRLASARSYLEFGSGGSTVLADKHGIPAVSVESDRYYAAVVHSLLSPQTKVTLLNVAIGITRQWGHPIFRSPTKARLARWRKYSSAPFSTIAAAEVFPDFVLVDGRFRRACVLETTREALLAGVSVTIMFDDYYLADRGHYHSVESWLGRPERVGRAAFFEVVPDGSVRLPTEDEVAHASADPR